jgi:putative Holliday junction resolvase
MLLRTGDPVRDGVRLAVDPGTVRIGVARSDRSGIIATPLTVVRRGKGDLDALASLAAAEEAIEILVGLPRSLSGREGPAAATARQFAGDLAARVAPLPVRLVDERFTTSTAHEALRAGGKDSRARRQTVDSAAAAVLLEAALESERRTGRVPGELVAATASSAASSPVTPASSAASAATTSAVRSASAAQRQGRGEGA